MTTKQAEKTKLELSCREARLILRILPLQKTFETMKQEESSAVKHYAGCKNCRDRGLAQILDTKLTCQSAILRWAENACALWLSHGETLIDEYAVEHVWGRYQWKNSMGGCGYDTITACPKRSCQVLHSYWAGVPMSSGAGDGPDGVIHLYPLLFDVFLEEKWALDELLVLQKKRVTEVLKNIESGKVTVSSGNYNSTDELMAEVREHIVALQKLAVRAQA